MPSITNFPDSATRAGRASATKPAAQLHSQRCAPRSGGKWLLESFSHFTRNPGNWAIAMLFLLLLFGLLAFIPVAGALVILLTAPVFLGGLMFGCHQLRQQRNFHSRYLFAGFEAELAPLLKLGVVEILWLLFVTVLAAAVFLLFGQLDFAALGAAGSAEELLTYLDNNRSTIVVLIIAMTIFSLGILLFACGSWLSPALVFLGQARPWQAFRLSMWGCLKNTLPLLYLNFLVVLIVSLLLAPLIFLSLLVPSLTFGVSLIAALLLLQLLPVLVVASYSMARDVFPEIAFYELPGINEVEPSKESRGYSGLSG